MTKQWILLRIPLAGVLALGPIVRGQSKPESTTQPARTVSGQVLKSTVNPAVRLEFDKAFKYVGTQSFILYEVAHAEQFFFVEADKEGRVKRFFWIQFEGYLPTNTYSYKYKLTEVVNADGFDFIADAYPRSLKGDLGRPDSDGNRARTFLAGKGFRMAGTEIISQRLVHLVDAEKRNELMIIYTEDLSDTGLTAADLNEGGSAHDRWNDVARGLLDRALKNMKVSKQ